MAQFIPTVPGVGGALGTGLSKSLNALAESKIKQMTEAPQRQAYANALLAILGGNPQEGEATPQQDSNVGAAGLIPQQASSQPQIQKNPLVDALKKGGINEQQLFQLAGLQQQKQLRANEQSKQARREEFEREKEVNKATQKYYDDVISKAEGARTTNKRLEKMTKLLDKGKLPFSGTYNFINSLENISNKGASEAGHAIGGPTGGVIGTVIGTFLSPIVGALKGAQRYLSPDTEEFEKLSADFIRDAKSIFGARITDADLKAFLQTVPTLSQTDAGKRKIISNIEAANKAIIAKEDALKEIVRENKSKRPNELQFLVEERARKKLDEAAREFSS